MVQKVLFCRALFNFRVWSSMLTVQKSGVVYCKLSYTVKKAVELLGVP
jgi:hypothetical protein